MNFPRLPTQSTFIRKAQSSPKQFTMIKKVPTFLLKVQNKCLI